MKKDKRKSKRVEVLNMDNVNPVCLPFWMSREHFDKPQGLLIDISLTGAKFLIPENLALPERFFRIETVPGNEYGLGVVNINAEKMWYNRSGKSSHIMGCSFLCSDDENREHFESVEMINSPEVSRFIRYDFIYTNNL